MIPDQWNPLCDDLITKIERRQLDLGPLAEQRLRHQIEEGPPPVFGQLIHLAEYADQIGLALTPFLGALATHIHAPRVHEDFLSGVRSGVNGTPTFFSTIADTTARGISTRFWRLWMWSPGSSRRRPNLPGRHHPCSQNSDRSRTRGFLRRRSKNGRFKDLRYTSNAWEESVERTDSNDDGVAGPVPESPRSADETTSSDATLDPRVATEEVKSAGTTSLPANDPDAGEERRKAYERGAILVSRID